MIGIASLTVLWWILRRRASKDRTSAGVLWTEIAARWQTAESRWEQRSTQRSPCRLETGRKMEVDQRFEWIKAWERVGMTGHESRDTEVGIFCRHCRKRWNEQNRCHREQRQPKSFLFVLEHRLFLILRRLGISHEQFHLTNCTLPKNPFSALSQWTLNKCYDIDYGNCHKFTASTSRSRIFRCLSSRYAYKKTGDRHQAVAPEAQIREMRAGCCFDWENANERWKCRHNRHSDKFATIDRHECRASLASLRLKNIHEKNVAGV